MNGSVNPQWEPFVTPVPREVHASRVPLAPALNVLLAASVVLVAVTLLSQSATRGFQLYRDNSIVLTAAQTAKVNPQAVPEPHSLGVPQALPRAVPQDSLTSRIPSDPAVTRTPRIALGESTPTWAPPGTADGLATRNEVGITDWPAKPLWLQASETGSALELPSGSVDRPVMTIAGPTQWLSNGVAASCRWPLCQFPTIAPPSLINSRAIMPLPPQLSDPWAFTFGSRLANQYSEAWEMLVLPALGLWGQQLDFGAMRLTATPYQWQLSTQTRTGLQFYVGSQLSSPLQWFGISATAGVGLRTPGGLDVVMASDGPQLFQSVTTPLGQFFGGITPYGPLAGGVFRSGSVSAYVVTLLSEGQPKVAGTIALQHGNLSLAYSDTTIDRALVVRFAQAPLDVSLGMSISETQLRLSYTPPSGPTILAFWSSRAGLNLLVVGSITFGGNAPARAQEYAAPSTPSTPPTLGAASNH